MDKPTAVILAAGMSRRMGQANKLLLPIAGEPMISHSLKAYLACCDEVVVVTGFAACDIRAALANTSVRLVHNPDFAKGQKTSVVAGLRAVGHAKHVLVGLGDQPWLKPQHVTSLVQAHLAADQDKISIPFDGEKRGNPIAIPGALIDVLLADPHAPGCCNFTRTRPECVNKVQLTQSAYYRDVDTPEAYASLTQTAMQNTNNDWRRQCLPVPRKEAQWN